MFFEETISCKVQREDHKKIIGIVNLNQDKYENISHFVRCATLKLMREEICPAKAGLRGVIKEREQARKENREPNYLKAYEKHLIWLKKLEKHGLKNE